MVFFDLSRPTIFRTEASLNEGSPDSEDRQGHATSTLHQPNNDGDQEEVQSNRKRCLSNQIGPIQGETENLPTWNTLDSA